GAECLVIQPDGKIVAAGIARNAGTNGLALVRVLPRARAVVIPEARGLALALILSGVGVAADAILQIASARGHPLLAGWFALGLALTAGFAIGWVFLMQTMKIATAGIIYAVASALLLVFIGVFFFEERLSASEVAGVAMALGAVVLLGRLTG